MKYESMERIVSRHQITIKSEGDQTGVITSLVSTKQQSRGLRRDDTRSHGQLSAIKPDAGELMFDSLPTINRRFINVPIVLSVFNRFRCDGPPGRNI
jgi:hypothetical protein